VLVAVTFKFKRILIVSRSQTLVTSKQLEFDLQIEKEIEVNGIGMGVLNDGNALPYGPWSGADVRDRPERHV
jgi:hypothetical protein